jgi:hypothetical protein
MMDREHADILSVWLFCCYQAYNAKKPRLSEAGSKSLGAGVNLRPSGYQARNWPQNMLCPLHMSNRKIT